jgi:hypothetical protein
VQLDAGVVGPGEAATPEDAAVFIPKYRPYSWTITSDATFDTPNSEWVQ